MLQQIFIEYTHMIQQCLNVFYIGSIDFMLKGKSSLEYTNLFSPYEYKKMIKNLKIIFVNKCLKRLG